MFKNSKNSWEGYTTVFLKERVSCGDITRNRRTFQMLKNYKIQAQKQESATLVVGVPDWSGEILT